MADMVAVFEGPELRIAYGSPDFWKVAPRDWMDRPADEVFRSPRWRDVLYALRIAVRENRDATFALARCRLTVGPSRDRYYAVFEPYAELLAPLRVPAFSEVQQA